MNLLGLPPLYYQTFILMFVRIAATLFTMPVFSSSAVPTVTKVGLAALLAFLLVPVNSAAMAPLPTHWLGFAVAIGNEMLVGLLLGFIALVAFTALQMAGQLVGLQIGLNIAAALDPLTAGQEISYIDQFYTVLTAVLFLTINGHHAVILALAQSFQLLPLNHLVFNAALNGGLIALTAGMFGIAFSLALPIVAALLLSDLAMLFLSRMMPQFNVFVLGQPLKIFMGLGLLLLGMPVILTFMTSTLQGIPPEMLMVLRLAGQAAR